MAGWEFIIQPGSGCNFLKINLNANLVEREEKKIVKKENSLVAKNTKTQNGVSLQALNAGLSEPKLGNVTTGLQRDSL